ncbi:ion channel [Thalassotalea atypica]|uniref:ion channel n=1 Tax=Thalassotalea atypica TaxID=2054316 RepID=UPI0025735A6D|nr:ion channel [Thalassotalea atypica]
MNNNLKVYTVDNYGVRNYNSLYLAIITLSVLYAIIALLSLVLVSVETVSPDANITTYKDAFWTLQMSASTIGFGDFYPVTLEGRIIVSAMFYIGVGMVGFIGAQFVNKFVGFSDTNVKNRELRRQNKEILDHNKQLEKKVDDLVSKIEQLIHKKAE